MKTKTRRTEWNRNASERRHIHCRRYVFGLLEWSNIVIASFEVRSQPWAIYSTVHIRAQSVGSLLLYLPWNDETKRFRIPLLDADLSLHLMIESPKFVSWSRSQRVNNTTESHQPLYTAFVLCLCAVGLRINTQNSSTTRMMRGFESLNQLTWAVLQWNCHNIVIVTLTRRCPRRRERKKRSFLSLVQSNSCCIYNVKMEDSR